jgi:hypothetical protein
LIWAEYTTSPNDKQGSLPLWRLFTVLEICLTKKMGEYKILGNYDLQPHDFNVQREENFKSLGDSGECRG